MQETHFIITGILLGGRESYIIGTFTRYANGGYFLDFLPIEGIFMGYSPSQKGENSESLHYDRKFQLSPAMELQGCIWRRTISRLIKNHLQKEGGL